MKRVDDAVSLAKEVISLGKANRSTYFAVENVLNSAGRAKEAAEVCLFHSLFLYLSLFLSFLFFFLFLTLFLLFSLHHNDDLHSHSLYKFVAI